MTRAGLVVSITPMLRSVMATPHVGAILAGQIQDGVEVLPWGDGIQMNSGSTYEITNRKLTGEDDTVVLLPARLPSTIKRDVVFLVEHQYCAACTVREAELVLVGETDI